MAEKVDSKVVEKGVEELEKEITCAICHEHYDEPKVPLAATTSANSASID